LYPGHYHINIEVSFSMLFLGVTLWTGLDIGLNILTSLFFLRVPFNKQ
jgi:hypothetical protein